MVIYDLRCDQAHQFEGWFRSIDDYQSQLGAGLLCCPICDSKKVVKIPTASYVQTGKRAEPRPTETPSSVPAPAAMSEVPPLLQKALAHLQDFIRHNSDDVGNRFAEEAKKIHYGEAEKRNIHGVASGDQLSELREEGIEVLSMPLAPIDKSKLN
ncbi:MAG: DUF1178 family protein [Gammaproteobacteria bacterium]|nr:DUF1178 family protein [Gammaproteobacteria bacterium]